MNERREGEEEKGREGKDGWRKKKRKAEGKEGGGRKKRVFRVIKASNHICEGIYVWLGKEIFKWNMITVKIRIIFLKLFL